MRAKFIGDPAHDGDGPDVFVRHGVEYPKGEFVDVPDEVAVDLCGNNHFEVDDGVQEPAVVETEPEEDMSDGGEDESGPAEPSAATPARATRRSKRKR